MTWHQLTNKFWQEHDEPSIRRGHYDWIYVQTHNIDAGAWRRLRAVSPAPHRITEHHMLSEPHLFPRRRCRLSRLAEHLGAEPRLQGLRRIHVAKELRSRLVGVELHAFEAPIRIVCVASRHPRLLELPLPIGRKV